MAPTDTGTWITLQPAPHRACVQRAIEACAVSAAQTHFPSRFPFGPPLHSCADRDTDSRIDTASRFHHSWNWLMATVATWKFDRAQIQHRRLFDHTSPDHLSVAAVWVPDHGIGKDPIRSVCRARHMMSLTTSLERSPRSQLPTRIRCLPLWPAFIRVVMTTDRDDSA